MYWKVQGNYAKKIMMIKNKGVKREEARKCEGKKKRKMKVDRGREQICEWRKGEKGDKRRVVRKKGMRKGRGAKDVEKEREKREQFVEREDGKEKGLE